MNKRVSLVLFTIAVTIVFIAPITFAYLLTKPIVALNEEVYLKRAVLAAAGLEAPPDPAGAKELFDARVEALPAAAAAAGAPAPEPVYRVKDTAGATAGWVITRTGPGLWGDIVMVVGFGADRVRLSGIEFLKQQETPGLGARVAEPWFKQQFKGKRGPFTTVGEGEPTAENQFDAITGATITSNAVKAIVNAVVDAAGSLPKEGTP
jgi:Na+-transporting NADH:ubiquinone oxidoreductase subunit C